MKNKSKNYEKELDKLNKEILLFNGWKLVQPSYDLRPYFECIDKKNKEYFGSMVDAIDRKCIYDYASDLNLIYKLEEQLLKDLMMWMDYVDFLNKLMLEEPIRIAYGSVIHATAEQRARGYLYIMTYYKKLTEEGKR